MTGINLLCLAMGFEITILPTTASRIAEFDENNIVFGKIFTDHMLVADYENGSWGDVRIVPYGPMELSPANSALHYGQSIFEGLKAFKFPNGDIYTFRAKDNWRRLNVSAERMCMPTVPEELFEQGLNTLLDLDRKWVPGTEGSSLYIRPYMFATDEYVGVKPSEKYRLIIFCCPVGPYYSKPLKVKVEEYYSRSAPGGTGFAKCAGNYGASMLPTKLAQDEGYDQVLWTDPVHHELVEETGTTNIFAVFKDKVVTPALHETLLAGITRDSVIQLLKKQGIQVEERALSVEELKTGVQSGDLKDVFITGTAATLINLVGFGHGGKFYDIMQNGDRAISEKVKLQLDQIRLGLEVDSLGWMQKIATMHQQRI